MNNGGRLVIFHWTVALVSFFAATSLKAEEPPPSLSMLRKTGSQIQVTYFKTFATCVHLVNLNRQIQHVQNFFCATNATTTANQAVTDFTPQLVVGQSYMLCHGNNYNICSSPRALDGAAEQMSVERIADLNFGDAVTGDPSTSIAPRGSGGAEFRLRGAPSQSFTFQLPSEPVRMIRQGARGAINVGNFRKLGPAALDSLGRATIYLGATRAAVPPNLPAGDYAGSFTVTVAY